MNKQKLNSTIQTILVTVFSFLFVTMISYATTIGANISTGGTLAVTGTTTLANASTTQLSVSNNLYTALTANSIPYITTSGLLTEDNSNLVWDGTNNRMGIGTSSPYAKLSIHANNGETNTTLFNIASSTASATTSLFTVLNNGNVGIGTDAPQSTLHINGGTGSLATGLAFGNGDSGIYESSNDTLCIAAGGSNCDYQFSNAALSSGVSSGFYLRKNNSVTYPPYAFQGDDNTGIYNADTDSIGFVTNGVEKVRINASGYFGVGTTSPATLIDAYSTATTTITLDSSSATNGGCLKIKNATTTGYIYCTSNGGGLQCSTTSCE